MSHVTLDVLDISCAHCEQTITKALTPQPGILSVKVDIAAQRVQLEYDPVRITLDDIGLVLAKIGYPITPPQPPTADRAVQRASAAPGQMDQPELLSTRASEGRPAARLRTTRVHARGEDFRIVQLQGNLFVCSKAHGNCCCGWTEKGRAPLNLALYESEWERRKLRNKLHLSFTGCLGPCAIGNNVMLQILGRSIWLKDLNDDRLIPVIFDYAETLLRAGRMLPPPQALSSHIYERYLPPPESDDVSLHDDIQADDDTGLERLDPVCLMDVDPATAQYTTVYAGRTFYFCAPSCKQAFVREPEAYLSA